MVLCCWATGLGLCMTGWCSSPGAALASRRKTHSVKSSGHTLPRAPCLRAGLGRTSAHTHALTPARVCDTSCLHTRYVRTCIPPHTPTRVPTLTRPYLHAHHTLPHTQVHTCTPRNPRPREAWEQALTSASLWPQQFQDLPEATPSGVRSQATGPHQPGDRRSPRSWAGRWRPWAQALSRPAAPADPGVSLDPSGVPAFIPSIQSSETDVCRPLWCPQQQAPGPQGDTPRAHACPGGA